MLTLMRFTTKENGLSPVSILCNNGKWQNCDRDRMLLERFCHEK